MTIQILMKDELTDSKNGDLSFLGQIANDYARGGIFADYYAELTEGTITMHKQALTIFSDYLSQVGYYVPCEELMTEPEKWQDVSWGLVKGFVNWLLQDGYSTGTVNNHLSSVRKHCKLAMEAGYFDEKQYILIRGIEGISGKKARNIDKTRKKAGIRTRKPGSKKAESTIINTDQAKRLKTEHPDTGQGRRDRLIMCVLLDLGLRAGEVSALTVEDINIEAGLLRAYHQKNDTTGTYKMTPDIKEAMEIYLERDAFDSGPLLRTAHKSGKLSKPYLSPVHLTTRVRILGEKILGITKLSAHDCRHYWTTAARRAGTPKHIIQQAGGWKSSGMVDYYTDPLEIANEGVVLPE